MRKLLPGLLVVGLAGLLPARAAAQTTYRPGVYQRGYPSVYYPANSYYYPGISNEPFATNYYTPRYYNYPITTNYFSYGYRGSAYAPASPAYAYSNSYYTYTNPGVQALAVTGYNGYSVPGYGTYYVPGPGSYYLPAATGTTIGVTGGPMYAPNGFYP